MACLDLAFVVSASVPVVGSLFPVDGIVSVSNSELIVDDFIQVFLSIPL